MPDRIPYRRPGGPDPPPPRPRPRAYENTTARKADKAFYASKRWRRLRARVLAEEPTCRECRRVGRIVPATTVDHIEPRGQVPALALDRSNLRAVCQPCNNRVRRDQARPETPKDAP